MRSINRRDFLKNAAFAALGFLPLKIHNQLFQDDLSKSGLGRILSPSTHSFDQPGLKSRPQQLFQLNDVIGLGEPIPISYPFGRQELWYRLKNGDYLPASAIQPVKNEMNEPIEKVNRSGQLAEITIPLTTAWAGGATKEKGDQIFYFGSTHWIDQLAHDREGILYYRVREDRWSDTYFIEASHMRVLPENDLNPKNTDVSVEEKLIRINLEEQYAVAYESNEPVFITKISSGQRSGPVDLQTPPGEFEINYKRPSRHMVHSDRASVNKNELYGVPWVSYFTETGIAFHGTYWHNDFSMPRSHGCINLPIEAARWIYLWTHPVVPPRAETYVSNTGTMVEVL